MNGMESPRVFIIILNWNGLEDTLECLESVFKLDYPNFRVVIVDNHSSDGSVEVLAKEYPKVKMIENHENLGYAGGNNIGIRHAIEEGAELVWLLNNDAVVESETLAKLIRVSEQSPQIGLVSPVIWSYGEPRQMQFSGTEFDWSDFVKETDEESQTFQNKDIRISVSLVGTALLIRRSIIEKAGYLNEKYFAYSEDNEYSVRVAKLGYSNVIVNSAKIYHKGSSSTSGEKKPIQMYFRTRNLYFLWMDNIEGLKKWKYFFRYLAYVISVVAEVRNEGLQESINACFDGAWCAVRGIGGPLDKSIRMPSPIKKLLYCLCSWHPYFWAGLIKGDLLNVYFEVIKRIRIKTRRSVLGQGR